MLKLGAVKEAQRDVPYFINSNSLSPSTEGFFVCEQCCRVICEIPKTKGLGRLVAEMQAQDHASQLNHPVAEVYTEEYHYRQGRQVRINSNRFDVTKMSFVFR
jgi:hypothetical protein